MRILNYILCNSGATLSVINQHARLLSLTAVPVLKDLISRRVSMDSIMKSTLLMLLQHVSAILLVHQIAIIYMTDRVNTYFLTTLQYLPSI